MDVSDVLRDRSEEPPGIQPMVIVSTLVHAALFAAIVFGPHEWFAHPAPAPKTVMTITLGGAPGPQNVGMTSIGGRPVQTETPPEAPKRPEPVRPPAAKAPEMTLPKPGKAPARRAAPDVKQAPPDATGRTPTRGTEASAGSAVADTGARGQGFGLSSGGGLGSGLRLDVGDFCCPDYLITMIQRIQANWNSRAERPGSTFVKFTVQRDGAIRDIALEQSSGYTALDIGAERALFTTRQLPPLPGGYPNPTLTIHLEFQYTR